MNSNAHVHRFIAIFVEPAIGGGGEGERGGKRGKEGGRGRKRGEEGGRGGKRGEEGGGRTTYGSILRKKEEENEKGIVGTKKIWRCAEGGNKKKKRKKKFRSLEKKEKKKN